MILFTILFTLLNGSSPEKSENRIQFGVFADCQFCECETKGNRYYQNSLKKLEDCILHFNQENNLEFIISLGDLIDRDIESYNPLLSVLKNADQPIFHVAGNHDYEVDPNDYGRVSEILNLDPIYYAFEKKGWQMIFLNGNDISFLSEDAQTIKQAEIITTRLREEGSPNYHSWNGGLGSEQLVWLEKKLKMAEERNLKVALFCHYPLMPLERHTLWNQKEIISLLNNFSCVKLWMNGHNHAGNYALHNGIHFVTLKGMVETESKNAFATVNLYNNRIEINGFGREENRTLVID